LELIIANPQSFNPIIINEPISNLLQILIIKATFLQIEIIDALIALQARHQKADALLAHKSGQVQLYWLFLVELPNKFGDLSHKVSLQLLLFVYLVLKLQFGLCVVVLGFGLFWG
jgi:hypothetical protein